MCLQTEAKQGKVARRKMKKEEGASDDLAGTDTWQLIK